MQPNKSHSHTKNEKKKQKGRCHLHALLGWSIVTLATSALLQDGHQLFIKLTKNQADVQALMQIRGSLFKLLPFPRISPCQCSKCELKIIFGNAPIVTSSTNTTYWYYTDLHCPHKAITSNWKQMVAQPPEPLPEGAVRCPTIKQSVLSVKGRRIWNIIPQAIREWPTHTTSKAHLKQWLKTNQNCSQSFFCTSPRTSLTVWHLL